ncbi:hypothetical protein RHGRI_035551 [Rhododendron griersonianum]|uniref:Uncharacterized protein n=1 Tax=Rhododendron griersonianum TaxID=479676 RepID=A0AAV6HK04_9ERIC|nr:hypothetical protein RHGRI_035551 [Rhododendron griersonianum]
MRRSPAIPATRQETSGASTRREREREKRINNLDLRRRSSEKWLPVYQNWCSLFLCLKLGKIPKSVHLATLVYML